jgi:hypothetical protein
LTAWTAVETAVLEVVWIVTDAPEAAGESLTTD